ncbi:hypothetical protein BBJ28_00000362 [Nothophytophthora sp. Chile5]|nr:hypothetical protein BBJ28_00000362 [Nothophytophthora sp. Chile5]
MLPCRLLRRPLPLALKLLARTPRFDAVQTTRFSSSSVASDEKATKKPEDEPMTNEKLWDKVLVNHPEQDDLPNGDLLYEYPRKVSSRLLHPVLGEPTFFSFVTDDFGSSVGFGMSVLLAGLIGFHARVGDLGEPIDVSVSDVSAHPNTKNNIILKLGSTRGFYLVDVKGKFYNREKLERLITFRTNFTEHEEMMKKKSVIEVRTDLPRTDLKAEAAAADATRKLNVKPKARYGNLLGKKHSGSRKSKGKKK